MSIKFLSSINTDEITGTTCIVSPIVCAATCLIAPVIQLTTGAASGCVLTSDANGVASWETPSGGGGTLSGLTDVSLSTLTNGDILRYDSGTTSWYNEEIVEVSTNLTAGQLLCYDGVSITGLTNISYDNSTCYLKICGTNISGTSAVGGRTYVCGGDATGSTYGCGGTLYLCGGNGRTISNPAGEIIAIGGSVLIRSGCACGLCGATPDKYISAGGVSISAGNGYATSGGSRGGDISFYAGCALGTSTTSNCGGSICGVGGNGYSYAGAVQLWAGCALCYGKGGFVCIRGGCSKQCCGGDVCINGGIGSCSGNLGGNVYIYGGCGCCGASGGTTNICGGNSTTASLYGNVDIYAGNDLIIRACHGSGSGYATLFYNGAAKLCTVTDGICLGTNCGFATDWVATSDCRLKTNIQPISNALSVVNQLCGVCYKFCDDIENENRIGLIAQEVLPILPEIVSHSLPSDDDIKYGITDDRLGLKYDKLTAILIEAIKEQQVQINELKLEIEKIKTC